MPQRDRRGRLSGGNPGNSGGKRGRSGRRPGWFREFAGKLLSEEATKAAIRARAQDPRSNGFWDGVKTLGQAAGEMPKDGTDLSGVVTIRVVFDAN